jgi:hypothetical protein
VDDEVLWLCELFVAVLSLALLLLLLLLLEWSELLLFSNIDDITPWWWFSNRLRCWCVCDEDDSSMLIGQMVESNTSIELVIAWSHRQQSRNSSIVTTPSLFLSIFYSIAFVLWLTFIVRCNHVHETREREMEIGWKKFNSFGFWGMENKIKKYSTQWKSINYHSLKSQNFILNISCHCRHPPKVQTAFSAQNEKNYNKFLVSVTNCWIWKICSLLMINVACGCGAGW